MTVTIYTLNFVSEHRPDAPFNVSFHPPDSDQKATTFIGHPLDRRTPPDTTKQWIVEVPGSAIIDGDKLSWTEKDQVLWLTAEEVFDFAHKQMHGFHFSES